VRNQRAAHDREATGSIDSFLEDPSLTEGQRRRLRLFQQIEPSVVKRIEEICQSGDLEIPDVAVLVIAPSAEGLFFYDADDSARSPSDDPTVHVLVGSRGRVHGYLRAVLPPAPDAPFDPYADLLEPAPPRCVRVLVLDDESLTVMSYGCFLTVRMDSNIAQA
jgi:hypothetical protein